MLEKSQSPFYPGQPVPVELVDIEPMSSAEMREFFQRAFETAAMTVDEDAMEILIRFSAGFPKIMHLIGDWAYWTDQDQRIDVDDAIEAVVDAAEDFGKKYVDQQVLAALRSIDYRSILAEITANQSSLVARLGGSPGAGSQRYRTRRRRARGPRGSSPGTRRGAGCNHGVEARL
jgi:hypothetical protein